MLNFPIFSGCTVFILTNNVFKFQFLYNLVNRRNCRSLHFCQSVGREIISHCILIFISVNDVKIFFPVFKGHLFLFFWIVSIHVSPKFSIRLLSFSLQFYWDELFNWHHQYTLNLPCVSLISVQVIIWHTYCTMTIVIRLVNTSITSHNYHFVVVRIVKIYFLSNFQEVYVLLTIVIMLYIEP